ncbi:MAG: hypothetical protein LJE74_11105 [Proteobacteria bacterium]|nr:hypothetical protein [Pseudomonadota bacterium]MCG6935082.1 hypothetical protein [Pseudomonadota bacterium]
MKTIAVNLMFALLLVLPGCASVDINHKFNDATFRYERALRWGNPQQATMFQKHPEKFSDKQLQQFKRIKITAYNLVDSVKSGNQVKQTVEIQYYRDDEVVVHTLMDHQLWEYDTDTGNWYLMTPIPTFK